MEKETHLTDEAVLTIISRDVNPMLKLYSGGCEFVSLKEGILTVKIFGGCSGCPSSAISLFENVSGIFRQHLPMLKDIHLKS